MAKYKAYPEYKDSGVDFLGLVPNEWSIKSLKNIVMIFNGSTPKSGVEEYWDGDVNWITPTDLSQKSGVYLTDSQRKITKKGLDSCGTSLVPENTVILSTRAPIGSLAITGTQSCTNQGCKSLVAKYKESSLFLYYYLSISTSPLKNLGRGSTFLELSTEDLASFKVPMPNVGIGTIVSFLDHETAKIDSLIDKQQQLIELLKEKRQAVISHAVTKGLNPDVPMKDSGVEWLGEVPEHWSLKSFRYACLIYRGKFGHRPRNDPSLYDGDYPFIQTGDVARASKFIETYSQTLNEKGKAVSQLFPSGTLMMAIAANIGDTAILGFEAYAPDSVVGFKPYQNLHLEFLRYSFMAALPALEQTSTQSTQANLNIDRIGAVKAVFPPLEEQLDIIDYLDNMLCSYDSIEENANQAIQLLQERRTALISAAVTGKIDVRDWVAPETQDVEEPQEATA
ncbi:restriction endonuclease subunit S [Atlantibacter hermannii]|uniref:restriction endonuclease subunit S n=1 Tax=Atlantibacter hermannii TaxID=565 RepID=UPI0025500605|nr:restriction endonuclease subunit S [Atlantibacter hermannii]